MTATWLLVIVVVSTQSRHVDSFPAAAIFEKPIYGCPGRTFGTRIPVDEEEPIDDGVQDESWTAPSVEDETEGWHGVSGPTAPGIEELMQSGQIKDWTPVHEEPTEEGTQDESWTAPSIEDETEGSRGVSGPTAPGIEELMQAMSELHEVVVNTRKDVNDTKKNTSVIPEMYGDVHKIQGNVNTTSRELQHTTASSCQSKACSYLTL